MANGGYYSASNIMVGDFVKTPQGFSKVKLIVETVLTDPINVAKVKNLTITLTHPIKIDNEWILPEKTKEVLITSLPKHSRVYSFVLESHHSIFVNGIETLCIGHDFYVKDSYLGNKEIIHELNNLADTDDVVRFKSSDFITKPVSNKVYISPEYYNKKKKILKDRENMIKTMLKMF